jgi:flavin reductase (DIM6/NTAB) family NADH-FMN oxidoreductase RutF
MLQVSKLAMTINVPPPAPGASAGASLRHAMRQVAGGVSVITVGTGADRTGLTVTSATALSLNPPTIIVCVNRAASAWPVLQRYGRFCMNVLGAQHDGVADRFAGRNGVKGALRYAEAHWSVLDTGAPMLADAIAAIDCDVEEAIERHSHAIVLGRVRAVAIGAGEPLVYARGGYGTFMSRDG